MSQPQGLAVDASGNVYIANEYTGTIAEVTPSGQYNMFAWGFSYPTSLAFDAAGNLYVANNGDGTISKVTPVGAVSTFASGFLPQGVSGLAFDGAGNLFVGNYPGKVSEVTPAGQVSTFASGFGGPTDLTFDSDGNLYVLNDIPDTAPPPSPPRWVLNKVTPQGGISTFATEAGEAQYLAFDAAGNLYISGVPYGNSGTVYKVTPAGAISAYVIDQSLNDPIGLAFDSSGNLYIADAGTNTLYKVDAAVSVPFTLGGTAVPGATFSNVTASPLVIPLGASSATITAPRSPPRAAQR